jgi:hypothetical protein
VGALDWADVDFELKYACWLCEGPLSEGEDSGASILSSL